MLGFGQLGLRLHLYMYIYIYIYIEREGCTPPLFALSVAAAVTDGGNRLPKGTVTP